MDQLQSADASTEPTAAEIARVEEVVRSISTALRSFRLYGGDSPMLERFLTAVGDRFREIWQHAPSLELQVEEHRFTWEGVQVFPQGGDSGDLPFLFYKDGVRDLTFTPGFEGEVSRFLGVIARASQVREEEDDLVTLLWEEDLDYLRYNFVEVSAETVELGGSPHPPPAQVDPSAVQEAAAAQPQADERGFKPDDFQETLYFLDEAELRRLADEVRREAERDLWGDVVSALFDRLEDGDPERQLRILHLFGELLSSMLGAGRLDRSAAMLRELVEIASRPGVLAPEALRQMRELFGQLADPATVQQLVQILEDSPDAVRGEHLNTLLGFFPPESLAPLMRSVEAVTRPDVRRVLEQAVERLATGHRDSVVALLHDSDPMLVAGAARWVARLQIGGAAQELLRLLADPSPAVRLAAIEAIQELRAATAGKALVGLLEDRDREVRVAAARALSALEFASARGPLEEVVTSKRIRSADRTEKIAFFEAYGRLAGPEGVTLLDRILNGKSWLGKGESAEIRACAALSLARVRHPSARVALSAAANDDDPVVRSAVARALRGEAS